MDYIIFGVGSGATLTLLGWLLRQFGPGIRDRQQADGSVLSASELVLRMGWARFCVTCGTALVLCGCVVMLVALAAMLLSVGDDRGGMTVVTTFALSLPLMLVWLAFFLRRFGAMGIIRRERKPEKEAAAAPMTPSTATSSKPDETGDGAPIDTPSEQEPTFSQAVSAPGGLGRFSAFFRQDDEPEEIEDEEPGDEGVDAEVRRDVTSAVIAAISGPGAGSEKRLDPDDPLVTSIMDGADHLEPAYVEPDPAKTEDSPASTSSSEKPNDEEAALRALREQRKRRLSGPT